MRWLLNLGYIIAFLLLSPVLVYKAITTGKYRRGLWAKWTGAGIAVDDPRERAWIHAVSVGEVLLLRPLLDEFRRLRPDLCLVLTTSTNTGYAVAKEKYPNTPVFYAPFDFTWAVARVFDGIKPRLLVLTELELWPNLLLEAKKRGVPVAVVNARLGERSFRGYSRIRGLLKSPLSAIRWWGSQTEAIAERIKNLTQGIGTEISVTGSMKFDGAPTNRNNSATEALRRLLPSGFQIPTNEAAAAATGRDSLSALPVAFEQGTLEKKEMVIWVAGSTQGDEERVIMDCFRKLRDKHRQLRLIIVPRHPERFNTVAELLQESGVTFVRRTELPTQTSGNPEIILWDSMGELAAVWGLADVGYVGGTLNCGRGGQSMIEPAGYGVPTCFGPEVWNFQEIADKLVEANAAVRLSNADQLLSVLAQWLDDPQSAAAVGKNARRYIAMQIGAVASTARALVVLLRSAEQSVSVSEAA